MSALESLGPQFTFAVDVGFTTVRPVKPDQHFSRVHVAADNETEAHEIAAQMVAGRKGVEMPTSTKTHSVEY